MRAKDILVLLRLTVVGEKAPTIRMLERSLGVPVASVHGALRRLEGAQLVDPARRVLPAQVDEFLFHALKYLFPPIYSGETRGMPTAWATAPLAERLASSSGLPPVWPGPRGPKRGIGLEPIDEAVPEIARRDAAMYERLAVLDALRAGDARIRKLAQEQLREWLAAGGEN